MNKLDLAAGCASSGALVTKQWGLDNGFDDKTTVVRL
jgi:hypothetical protein